MCTLCFLEYLLWIFHQGQEALRALWYAAYPGQELQALVSDQWKEMGWQGRDPSTDFRLLFCYMSWGLLVYLLYYLLARYLIFIALKSFYLIQRSWIHLFGEFVVLCKDILSKILNFIWPKKKKKIFCFFSPEWAKEFMNFINNSA